MHVIRKLTLILFVLFFIHYKRNAENIDYLSVLMKEVLLWPGHLSLENVE